MNGTSFMLSGLPLWVQLSANLGVILVAVVAAAYGYFRQRSPTTLQADKRFVLEAAAITDMMPMRDLCELAKRIAEALEAIRDSIVQSAEEIAIEHEVTRRLSQRQERQP